MCLEDMRLPSAACISCPAHVPHALCMSSAQDVLATPVELCMNVSMAGASSFGAAM